MKNRAVCYHLMRGALLVVLAASPAHAYTLLLEQQSGSIVRLRWPANAQPIHLQVNNRTVAQLLNVTPDSDPAAAIGRALLHWPAAAAIMFEHSSTPVESAGSDGVNVITLADTAANRQALEMAGGPVGLTLSFFQGADLKEADILFNPAMRFTTTLDTDGALSDAMLHDVEAVATHELGHLIGLHHSGVESASMWAITSVLQRTLDADDVAGARTLYPVGIPSATIHGAVTVGGAAAFGAHVVAVGASGVIAASALTLADGTYAIESIPPDMYTLYVEPLDGPQASVPNVACVRVGNLSGAGIYDSAVLTSNFPTTFLAGTDASPPLLLQAGDSATVNPTLPAGANAINPTLVGPATVDHGAVSASVSTQPLRVTAGTDQWVTLAGPSLDQASGAGVSIVGPGITVDTSSLIHLTGSCGNDPLPFIVFHATIDANAPPGGRTIVLRVGTQVSAMTGALDVANPHQSTPCVGDCGGDRMVTVDELLTMVNIALNTAPVAACEAGDSNQDGEITIDEILTAVNNALGSCPTP